MKAEKLRELDDGELGVQARELQEQLFRLQFQLAMGQSDGLKKYRVLKKDRAKILTIMREREQAASAQAEVSGGKGR